MKATIRSRLARPCRFPSSTATAALLGGNVEVGLLGGIGVVNAFVNGATDLVLIGSIKNFMTQSILARPEITKLQELKGKKIGVVVASRGRQSYRARISLCGLWT